MQAFRLLDDDTKTITHQSMTAPGKMFTDYLSHFLTITLPLAW